MALLIQTHTSWAWAVLDGRDRVVLLLQGAGAWEEAQEWAARGYRVTEVELDDSPAG
jgi:hypothetical protein